MWPLSLVSRLFYLKRVYMKMCGGEGNHFLNLKISTEDLCQYFRNNMETMLLYKASSQYKPLIATQERYHLVLNELKVRLKDVPLDYLIKLSNENQASLGFGKLINNNPIIKPSFYSIMDPDTIPDTFETISDLAKKEIHRRTFKGMTLSPKKGKIEATYLGFPRKPKF